MAEGTLYRPGPGEMDLGFRFGRCDVPCPYDGLEDRVLIICFPTLWPIL